jgi:hypothetical protein
MGMLIEVSRQWQTWIQTFGAATRAKHLGNYSAAIEEPMSSQPLADTKGGAIARPAKRLRTEDPESVNQMRDIMQANSGASTHVEDAEKEEVFESKDPSRAADLYLDTVCSL